MLLFLVLSVPLNAQERPVLPIKSTDQSSEEQISLTEVIDQLKGIEPTSAIGMRFQSVMEALARRLVGDEWVNKNHPQFLLLKSSEANAYFINGFEKPTFAVTTGLVDLTDNLDEMAFIFGHEYRHWAYRQIYGDGENSKLEEQTADLGSVSLMIDANFDPTMAYEISKKLLIQSEGQKVSNNQNDDDDLESELDSEDTSKYDNLFERLHSLFDPHPVSQERLRRLQFLLTGLENRRGRLKRELTLFEGGDKALFISAEPSQDYIQSRFEELQAGRANLSLEDELAIYKQLIEESSGWTPGRAESLATHLNNFIERLNGSMFSALTIRPAVFIEVSGDPQGFKRAVDQRNKILGDLAEILSKVPQDLPGKLFLANAYSSSIGKQYHLSPQDILVLLISVDPREVLPVQGGLNESAWQKYKPLGPELDRTDVQLHRLFERKGDVLYAQLDREHLSAVLRLNSSRSVDPEVSDEGLEDKGDPDDGSFHENFDEEEFHAESERLRETQSEETFEGAGLLIGDQYIQGRLLRAFFPTLFEATLKNPDSFAEKIATIIREKRTELGRLGYPDSAIEKELESLERSLFLESPEGASENPTDDNRLWLSDLSGLRESLSLYAERGEGSVDEKIAEISMEVAQLFKAKDKAAATRSAKKIKRLLSQLHTSAGISKSIYRSPIGELKEKEEVPWNALIPFLEDNPVLVQTLWQLGIHEARVLNAIPREQLNQYFSEEKGFGVYFDPEPVLSVTISDRGFVDSHRAIGDLEYEMILANAYRSLFVQALFNPEMREGLLEIVSKYPMTGSGLYLENFFAEMPRHVLALNANLLSDPENEFAFEKMAELFKKLIDKDPENGRMSIEEFFLGEGKWTFFDTTLKAGAIKLSSDSAIVKFILGLPDEILSLEKKTEFMLKAVKSENLSQASTAISLSRDSVSLEDIVRVRDKVAGQLPKQRQEILGSFVETFLEEKKLRWNSDDLSHGGESRITSEELGYLLIASGGEFPFLWRERVKAAVRDLRFPRALQKRIELLSVLMRAGLSGIDPIRTDKILDSIVNDLSKKSNPGEVIRLMRPLISGPSIQSPKLRRRLMDIYSEAAVQFFGVDDSSEAYYKKLKAELVKWGDDQTEQKLAFWSGAAKALELQPGTWQRLKSEIHGLDERALTRLNDGLLLNEVHQMILSECPIDLVVRFPAKEKGGEEQIISVIPGEIAEATIEFLLRPATEASIDQFLKNGGGYLLIDTQGVQPSKVRTVWNTEGVGSLAASLRSVFGLGWDEAGQYPPDPNFILRAQYLHENFWSSGLPTRAAYLDSVMHPDLVIDAKSLGESISRVVDRLIPESQNYAEETRRTLVNYLNLLPEYQQGVTLAALLAADRAASETQDSNLGARLGLFLDMKGPAEAKLGQSIHSFPETPEELKKGLGDLKADREMSRIELIETYRRRIPEEMQDKIKRLGKVLGVASYYVVVEVEMKDGTKKVLRMLRQNSREIADLGFGYLEDLADVEKDSPIGQTLARMINHARSQLDLETDTSVGQQQTQAAASIYENVNIQIQDQTFNFKTYPFLEVGSGYALLDLAPGVRFNDLPDSREKRLLAEAYLHFELEQMLSGGRFDHDRHGAQMLVNGSEIAILDHGGLALEEPTSEQRRALGQLLFQVVNQMSKTGTASRAGILRAFQEGITELGNSDRSIVEYLVSFQRSLLALGDFYSSVDPGNTERTDGIFLQHLEQIVQGGGLHPEITEGFMEQMLRSEGGINAPDFCKGSLGKIASEVTVIRPEP